MEYAQLTEVDRVNMLRDRQRQYEAEHFNHAANKQVLEASATPDDDEATIKARQDAIDAANAAMVVLENAHDEVTALIAELPVPDPDQPTPGPDQPTPGPDQPTPGPAPEPSFDPFAARAAKRGTAKKK